jgi:hypothetical protein
MVFNPGDIGELLITSLTMTGILVKAEKPLLSLALNVTVKFFDTVRFKTPL